MKIVTLACISLKKIKNDKICVMTHVITHTYDNIIHLKNRKQINLDSTIFLLTYNNCTNNDVYLVFTVLQSTGIFFTL